MSESHSKAFEIFDWRVARRERVGLFFFCFFFLKCDRHAVQSVANLEETLGNLAAISG